jgi:uncharacterized Ntn-hydrolase superfamily protein
VARVDVQGGKGTGAWRALLLAVLALALSAQAVLVGAHRHEPARHTHVAGASSGAAGHDGHHCAICEMERVGGHYLAAGGVGLAGAAMVEWLVTRAAGKPLPVARGAVGWQSRAPPEAGLIPIA